ncbi:MAG: hypothetical protein IPJ03_19480 [Ignavibacteriales bacterium]|nr:hypothetical protein [Ignavibacteriales bacterium]
MKQHFVEIEIDGEKIIHFSGELQGIFENLKTEDKLLGIVYSENEIKVVETIDFFDFTKIKFLDKNLTIVIDRNLLIIGREIFDMGQLVSKKHTYFCALLAYAIFTNAQIDPTISIYEGGDSSEHKALDDIYKFRVVDNLSFDSVVDLIYGDIDKISQDEWNKARIRAKSIDKISENENFNKTLNIFKENYPYLLKATLLLRLQGVSLYNKIKMFNNWMINEYVTKAEAVTIVLYCFYKSGGIIKNYNTNDYLKLIGSIKNATWDVSLISYMKVQSPKNPNRYYLLATDDKNLLSACKYFFTPDTGIVDTLFGNKSKEVHQLIEKVNRVCLLPDREKIVLERLNRLDAITSSLIRELEESILKNPNV